MERILANVAPMTTASDLLTTAGVRNVPLAHLHDTPYDTIIESVTGIVKICFPKNNYVNIYIIDPITQKEFLTMVSDRPLEPMPKAGWIMEARHNPRAPGSSICWESMKSGKGGLLKIRKGAILTFNPPKASPQQTIMALSPAPQPIREAQNDSLPSLEDQGKWFLTCLDTAADLVQAKPPEYLAAHPDQIHQVVLAMGQALFAKNPLPKEGAYDGKHDPFKDRPDLAEIKNLLGSDPASHEAFNQNLRQGQLIGAQATWMDLTPQQTPLAKAFLEVHLKKSA